MQEPVEVRPGRSTARAVSVLALGTTVGHLVRRAQQVHAALWTEEFAGEITGPQYAVLSVLATHGSLHQAPVGELASVDKSSTADVVARLMRHGWVSRHRDPEDGRRNVLHLTPAARLALPDVSRRVGLVQVRLLEPLAPDEREELTRLLAHVAYADHLPRVDVDAEAHPGEAASALVLHRTPGHLIRRTHQMQLVYWGEELDSDITPTQYAVLCALGSLVRDQSEVGDLASLDKSSTADVVARLVRRGWLARHRPSHDARRNLLQLTDAAVANLSRITPAVARVQERLLQPLDRPRRDRLVCLLHAIGYREDGVNLRGPG